ncbi:MAG: hypothetical protein ACMVO5_07685 [Polymorphobacter sp.]|uniref:hypothetical protein n=1 Tax=Polymorphobacter sp. TaxID=1909290 RepID=UPI003A896987
MTQRQHKAWLHITALIVGSFGPVFALGALPETAEPARWSLDLLSWPLDGNISYSAPTTRFLSALTGGFLFGWGVLIWFLAARVHDLAPEPVRQAVLASLLAWFLLDSAGSILSGNAINVLFNILVLLLAVGPLWRPHQVLPPTQSPATAPKA